MKFGGFPAKFPDKKYVELKQDLYFCQNCQGKKVKVMKETFGEYINQLRSENGLTLTKLAAALDIDQSTLSKIENGKRNIPNEILPKLAIAFNLDLKKLEHEYFSEKIAEIIYPQEELQELLKAAEEKAKYLRIKKQQQGKINF